MESVQDRWEEDLHQMAIDLAVMREKISAIERYLAHWGDLWGANERRLRELEKKVVSIRTVGITLITLVSLMASLTHLWQKLLP